MFNTIKPFITKKNVQLFANVALAAVLIAEGIKFYKYVRTRIEEDNHSNDKSDEDSIHEDCEESCEGIKHFEDRPATGTHACMENARSGAKIQSPLTRTIHRSTLREADAGEYEACEAG